MTPILTGHTFDIISHSAKQTFGVGQRLGKLLVSSDVVCLRGNLGTGKTCLTQGIGAGLTVGGIISSPTFAFVNEHPPLSAGPYLYHIDLYRISDFAEALSLGLEDYLYGDGVTVIEWADRAIELLPPRALWVRLDYVDYGKRSLLFESSSQHYVDIMAALREDLFGHSDQTRAEAPTPGE